MSFINAQKKRISRLVIILGNDYLKEVFRSQVTIAMLRPIKFHQLCLEILKKPGGKERRVPNNSGVKYRIRFPRNAKEAVQFDTYNGKLTWQNEILKELDALMSMKLFKKILSSLRKAREKGFQFAPLRIIFDIKVDLRRKSRLVIGGHVVDSSGQE